MCSFCSNCKVQFCFVFIRRLFQGIQIYALLWFLSTLFLPGLDSGQLIILLSIQNKILSPNSLQKFILSSDHCTLYYVFTLYSKEVILSTGVAAEPTHWRQTALWLEPDNCTLVKVGDVISGLLTYKRSTQNARDYNLRLDWDINSSTSASAIQGKTQNFRLAS